MFQRPGGYLLDGFWPKAKKTASTSLQHLWKCSNFNAMSLNQIAKRLKLGTAGSISNRLRRAGRK
jgi:hypothetical protein